MKPKEYIDEKQLTSLVYIKARRKGMTFSNNIRRRELYTTKGIPKYLSRKEKKRRYGTRNNRKSLAITLLEEKNQKSIKSIVDHFTPKRPFPIEFLTKNNNNNNK